MAKAKTEKKTPLDVNRIQILIQLYDKGRISIDTILKELGLDYNSELEKIRQEAKDFAYKSDK